MTALDPMALPLSGGCLIEAGAGTGKTYTIASIFLRLVLSGRPVREILVVTFTEAATAELKDRLRKRLREAHLAFQSGGSDDPFMERLLKSTAPEDHPRAMRLLVLALSGFDEAAVFTIHSFCLRVLRENAFESGVMFEAELSKDPEPIYRDIAADYWALSAYNLPGAWVRYLGGKNAVTPESLAGLLSLTAGETDRRVIPEREDATGDPAMFQELYHEARAVWQGDRGAIEDLFATHPGVNRKSYSRRYLPGWMKAVDDYFRDEEPKTLHGDGAVAKFARSRIKDKAAGIKGAPEPPRHRFFDLCEEILDFGPRWRIQFQRRFVDYGLDALAGRKRDLGIRFFSDLIQDLDRALLSREGSHLADRIRERYKVALIDEFQDTDLAQYRIFRTIYHRKETPLFMIGDPKQSIYAFRGADIFAYLQAAKDAKGNRHTLTVNWRSDPTLIRAVNSLFDGDRVSRPFAAEEIGFKPAVPRPGATDGFALVGETGAPLEFLFIGGEGSSGDDPGGRVNKEWTDEHLPAMTVADICRLLESGSVAAKGGPRPLTTGDIAILVRTNRQGRMMQKALGQAGVPTVLASRESVFDSREAEELGRILRGVASPPSETAMLSAMATDLLGVSGRRMDEIRGGGPEWEWWAERFQEWHRIWMERGFVQMITRIFFDRAQGMGRGFLTNLISLEDGERRVTNFQHLAELLQGASRRENLGPTGLLRWFERQRSNPGEAPEASELRLESDDAALKIVTIHKSKGLEYPVVYLPYLWDAARQSKARPPAQCHLPHEENRPVLDLGSGEIEAHLALAQDEQKGEDLRLLYVALTRARNACRVVWGPMKGVEDSALAYLIHRPGAEDGEVPDFARIAGHVRGMAGDDMAADLQRLAKNAGGAIGIREMNTGQDAAYNPEKSFPPALECRRVERVARRRWRIESFSRLVADASRDATPEEEMGLDHDREVLEGAVSRKGAMGAPPGVETKIPLAAFSQGADAGIFFHAIYENLDFTETDPVVVSKVVSRQLSDFGYDEREWGESVAGAVSGTLYCPMDPNLPEMALRKISIGQRLNEMAFLFPSAREGAPGRGAAPNPDGIGRVFQNYAGPAVPGEYARRVAALGFAEIRGFLKGFIDLVFEYQGRWYLVDYKSNHLGASFEDYDCDALTRVMADHHYFLQYHIYMVALHRYLAYRIPDYDYDRHFGGVYYLFIRGMSPETGSEFGVFRDRPGREFVEAFNGLF